MITRFRTLVMLLPVLAAILAASLLPSAALKPARAAPNLQQPKTYDGIEFPLGDLSFADRVISWRVGSNVNEPLDDAGRALGVPDQEMTSLGNGTGQCESELILEFVDNYLVDLPGDDLYVFERGPAVEATELFISTDARNWINVGKIEGSVRGVDISASANPNARYPFVRLCDFPDGVTSGEPWGGPDVDAVGAIGSVFRPEDERTPPPPPGTGDPGTGTGTDPVQPQQPGQVAPGAVCGVYTGVTVPPPGSGTVAPWDTAQGQGCFDRWIALTESRLNAYDGDDDFNARKRWHVNEYGLFEGNPRIGPTSLAAPDNFSQFNNNRYWWMWEHYPGDSVWDWDNPNWRGAQVPPLRPYVARCLQEMGATALQMSVVPASGFWVQSTVPGNDFAPPPFGSFPEPAPVGQMALQAGQRLVPQGALVHVPVFLLNGSNVANANFNIAYDKTVARPEGDLVRGAMLNQALFEFNTAEPNLIRTGFSQQNGIYGTGAVTYVPFRAVGAPGTRTDLCLEVTTINDPAGTVLTIDRIHGFIEIVNADGSGTGGTGPGGGGIVPGDCIQDGILDERDAACALQMSVNLRPELPWMDMDGSGDVTSRDATLILQQANVSLAGP